mgnify:CR=1 FL=1
MAQTFTTRETRTFNEVVPGGFVTQGINQVAPMIGAGAVKNVTSLGAITTGTMLTPRK